MISITWINRCALHQFSDFFSAIRELHHEVGILEFSNPIGACKVAPVLPISHSWPGLISTRSDRLGVAMAGNTLCIYATFLSPQNVPRNRERDLGYQRGAVVLANVY